MSKAMELRIDEFNNWATERVKVAETLIKGYEVPLNYRLNRKEQVHKDVFEKCFKSAYFTIETEIEDAKWRAEEANIPEEVLEKAVKAFKELKAKVSKEKAEYKRAIEELQESISQSVEDEANVQKSEKQVADIVKAWCGAHKIKDGLKDRFTGEKLQEQIYRITINILTSRLHPNEDELKEITERQLKYFTVA